MSQSNGNQQPTERRDLIGKCVTALCEGLGLRVEDSRIVFYARALDDLTPTQLKHGFDIATRNLGAFLPDVKQLRDWCESWRPPGYQEPVKPLEKADLTRIGAKLKVTKEEIAQWLEEGKRKAETLWAALEADPAHQSWKKHWDERTAQKTSRVPEDPEERKVWATEQAAPWRKQ